MNHQSFKKFFGSNRKKSIAENFCCGNTLQLLIKLEKEKKKEKNKTNQNKKKTNKQKQKNNLDFSSFISCGSVLPQQKYTTILFFLGGAQNFFERTSYLQIDHSRTYTLSGGARSVMDMVVGNEQGDTSSNPVCISYNANTLAKDINPTPPSYG